MNRAKSILTRTRAKSVIGLVASLLLNACSIMTLPSANLPSPASVTDLAPTGKLRAAINFGNPILATRDAATGEARGVSVDLARELGKRLGVPVELVTYTAAGKVVDGIKSGAWDLAFFAVDPVRGADTDFTAAYVVITGSYLVRGDSPIQGNDEVDREGVRVVVGGGSAYDLYLTRELKKATLVRVATSQIVTDTMLAEKIEAAAGVTQQLEADAKRISNVRLLGSTFMVINQAMAVPKGRAVGLAYASAFVEEMKASGFVADALKRHGIHGAAVAAAAR